MSEAAVRFHEAVQSLARGDYARGWPLYESRVEHLGLYRPETTAKPWKGENLAGKRLLVLAEQGYGDQIQFARFLSQTGAESVVYWCSPPLCRLFLSNGVSVSPSLKAMGLPPADYWVRALSLPLVLGVTLDQVCGEPYLKATPRKSGGVGLVTKGNPQHLNDVNRSLPDALAAELRSRREWTSLDPVDTGARDFLDTAEIIAGLDLVVTVDTSVAHLAGALGKPTWIMLPAFRTDWRWLSERQDTPWYSSARLYRQSEPGDWRSVLDAVEADLRSF